MADFNVVTGTQFLVGGAIGDFNGVLQLWEAGARSVMDCQAEYDDASLITKQPGMTYIWLPTQDDGQPKPTNWFKAGYDYALHATPNIYVHCALGINRGPSMCYFLLRALKKLSAKDAEALIRSVRPQVGLRYKDDADKAIIALSLT